MENPLFDIGCSHVRFRGHLEPAEESSDSSSESSRAPQLDLQFLLCIRCGRLACTEENPRASRCFSVTPPAMASVQHTPRASSSSDVTPPRMAAAGDTARASSSSEVTPPGMRSSGSQVRPSTLVSDRVRNSILFTTKKYNSYGAS